MRLKPTKYSTMLKHIVEDKPDQDLDDDQDLAGD